MTSSSPSATDRVVDLRSDTVTRPTAPMRDAIAHAEVGDHLLGDDPTAAELERFGAELLGKERALFFPSGTMANQTAINLHARPGTEAVVMWQSHVLLYEEGGAATWSGVQLHEVGSSGDFDIAEFTAEIRPPTPHLSDVTLICLENTHNTGGGRVMPVKVMRKVVDAAKAADLPVHLDGARLPNAAIAAGVPMRAWGELADTVMISLSKGLGAPIGSLLAGSAEAMHRADRIRRRFGGAMRQAGIIAAAGLYALHNQFERIADDHRRARDLAEGVAAAGLAVVTPQTNIVIFEVEGGPDRIQRLVADAGGRGVLLEPFGGPRVRAVAHLNVDDAGIEKAVRVIGKVFGGR